MNKKIFLIGLNLYSIFLSLKIRSQYKNADITIIEGSGNFLNAYKKVKIKNFTLNPGFHALENIRSKKLINLLKKEIKFKKISKTRGIIVGKKLVSYIDNFDKWPNEIINKFNIKKNKIIVDFSRKNNPINKHYIRYLTDNYFGKEVKIKSGLAAAYPWFFPSNYDLISNDEAAIFNTLLKLKRKKKINKLGVSVYTRKELEFVIKNYKIDIVNLPISVANQEFCKKGYLSKIKRNKIEIHARSVFLQGLLLTNQHNLPKKFKKNPFFLQWFKWLKFNNHNPLEASLGFVKNKKYIDKIIIGVDNFDQLKMIVKTYNKNLRFRFKNFKQSFILRRPSKW